MRPDWSLLPEELLEVISENLESCFDVVHARSVCRTWRSAFPFPSSLLRPRYLLPTFTKFPSASKNLCYLEKKHLFLFRVRAPSQSEYIMGGIRQDQSKTHMQEHPCPLQCSVKVKIPGCDKTLMNMLDCHILPLGYEYIMTYWDSKVWKKHNRGLAVLELNKEGEFVVVLSYKKNLLVLRSGEMKWMRVSYKVSLKPANMTEPATEEKTSSSSDSIPTVSMPDWSLLPEELLHMISKKLDDQDYCFDVVHARSVCGSWRSSFPFPSCLLRPSYSLPPLDRFPCESTVEKIPVFLFRIRTPAASYSEYFLGDIGRDNSEDRMELPFPLQCSVKVKIPGSDPTLMKLLDCQILSLGHQYRLIGWNPESLTKHYRGVAYLPLDKEGGAEFVVLTPYSHYLLVLTSAEMRWMRLRKLPRSCCRDVVTFRGRFYAVFYNRDIFVIDPCSLEATSLMSSPPLKSQNYLVPSGNDELFLVQSFYPNPEAGIVDLGKFACRVSRLDEEAGKWVVVSELGDRVLFIRHFGNVCCSAKELPDDCGVTGNSILFTLFNRTYAYKYGVPTENAEDDLNVWRLLRDNRLTILNKSPPVVALRVEC